jgi:DNA-binding response OmpR family regulator
LLHRSTILLVEADDLVRSLLERWLGEAGYAILIGDTGRPRDEPALVILNVASPRKAAALVRALQLAYSAPLLLISARFRQGLSGSSAAARRFGVQRVLSKPFTREELLTAVRGAIELGRP